MYNGEELLGDPDGVGLALSDREVDLRVLDALGQAGLSEQTLCDLVELEVQVVRRALSRLQGQGHVTCSQAADRKPAEPSEVWVATAAGRSELAGVFRQPHTDDRIRRILLVSVDDLNPTTPELTARLRWHLPALGLRRLRDVHQGWVRAQLAGLADEGMVRAVEEQTRGDVVWLALRPVGDELLRLEAMLGSQS